MKDPDSANWVVRKVMQARAYAARVEAWAAVELRRATREEEFFLTRYGPQLQTWARAELARQRSRGRCLHLPAGTIGFRVEPAKLAVSSEGVLLNWCREHLPESLHVSVDVEGQAALQVKEWVSSNSPAAQIRERVNKTAVSERTKATGELPDGTFWTGPSDKFYVK